MPRPTVETSSHDTPHTIIIGAGWGGLAAAIELSKHQHHVTVLESAKHAGGRARRTQWDNLAIDNGQHLLIGAYQQTRALMKTIGLSEDALFHRLPMELLTHLPEQQVMHIKAPLLPAPLHITSALLTGRGISIKDRLRAVRFCLSLLISPIRKDISVTDLLNNTSQSSFLITHLWEPLCIAMLNTGIEQASAQVFRRVLLDTFTRKQSDSDFLIPAADLGTLFPDPAQEFIEQHNGTLLTEHRVVSIDLNEQQQHSVTLSDGQQLFADHIIVATPPYVTKRLLEAHTQLKPLCQQLARFEYAPICTVYLQYPMQAPNKHVHLSPPAQGMTGTLTQWVFDRRVAGQPGLMAVVISAEGEHMTMDNPTLTATAIKELAHKFPDWPHPENTFVIREKRATFTCSPGINDWRPDTQTNINNLWLAGDYINTGYPATLEGAVISGIRSAEQVLAS